MTSSLLELDRLNKAFEIATRTGQPKLLRAVSDVSLSLAAGETLAIVGESGCGKTTLGRLIMRLTAPTSGRILFEGRDITKLSASNRRRLATEMQIVFQDPYSALNPRMRVGKIIAEPLSNTGMASSLIRTRVAEAMGTVGLPVDYMDRFPHEFSGGQRQRIGIARALVVQPRMIVCDEAVSALDVSVQAQILNLLREIQRASGVALVFISHNLGVVRFLADRVAVMYLGRVVELAPSEVLFTQPMHPYTVALLSVIPEPDLSQRGRRRVLEGDLPSPIDPPPGCPFHKRCPNARDLCRVQRPELATSELGHEVACHFPEIST